MASSEMLQDELVVEALSLSRAYLYTLFSKALGGEPTEELLEILCSQAAQDAIDEYGSDDKTLNRYMAYIGQVKEKRLGDDGFLDSALSEYTRIFFSFDKGSAPLAESAYRSEDGGYFDETTLAVRKVYRGEGVLPAKYPRVPDDHISLELGFMSIMAERSLEVLRRDNLVEFASSMELQHSFLASHLSRWVQPFADKIRKGKTTVLYPQIAAAVAAFVDLDTVFTEQARSWALDERRIGVDGTEEPLADCEAVRALKDFNAELERCKQLSLPHLEDNTFKQLDQGA